MWKKMNIGRFVNVKHGFMTGDPHTLLSSDNYSLLNLKNSFYSIPLK